MSTQGELWRTVAICLLMVKAWMVFTTELQQEKPLAGHKWPGDI